MHNLSCKILLTLTAICCTISSCDNNTLSEDQSKSFVRYYPNSAYFNEEGYDLVQLTDGGYLITGTSFRTTGDVADREITLLITDEFGMQKENSPVIIENEGNDFGFKVIPVDDGYVIAGTTRKDATSTGYLVKINTKGEMAFRHNIGIAAQQEFYGINESSDNGFILTGFIRETGGDKQVYLVKTDEWGLTQWERTIGFTGYNDIGEAVVEYGDRIIIAGTTDPVSSSAGNSRLLILNTNSEGKGMTELRISEAGDLTGADMLVDDNDNIIILGNQKDLNSGLSSLYFAKINLEGFNNELITILNATNVGFLESIYGASMVKTGNNSFAVCGWKGNQDNRDILFALIDQNFNLKTGIQTFGSTGDQAGSGICVTSDGGYAITGSVKITDITMTMLMKIGADGEL